MSRSRSFVRRSRRAQTWDTSAARFLAFSTAFLNSTRRLSRAASARSCALEAATASALAPRSAAASVANRAVSTRFASATRVALAKRVETARFAAEATAERCAATDAAAASRAQERADAALDKRRVEFKKAVEKAKKRSDDVAQVWARRDRRTNDRLQDMRVLPAKAAAAA